MLEIEQIHQDINSLSEEAKILLIDFLQLLKKHYPKTDIKNINSTSKSKAQAFREWAESHKNKQFPKLSDEDISRESIYGERG